MFNRIAFVALLVMMSAFFWGPRLIGSASESAAELSTRSPTLPESYSEQNASGIAAIGQQPDEVVRNPKSVLAQEGFDALAAYQHLTQSPTFPKDFSEEDDLAIGVIRQQADEVIPALRATLSKDGTSDRILFSKVFAIFHILPQERKLEVARAVVGTYAVGSGDNPLLQFLAFYGGEEDMNRLQAEISAAPDGLGVSIAIAIVESQNQEGLRMLKETSGQVEGFWQNQPLVSSALELD